MATIDLSKYGITGTTETAIIVCVRKRYRQ